VLNTTPEDQAIAEQVARELLFPKPSDQGDARGGAPERDAAPAAPPAPIDDPTAGILADLAAFDFDLDAIDDLAQLEEALAEEQESGFGAFELFERLYSSAVREERALAELCMLFGGPAALQAEAILKLSELRGWLEGQLSAQLGELRPAHVYQACKAGLSDCLEHGCEHTWERVGTLAGTQPEALPELYAELLAEASPRELGRSLSFLQPFEAELEAEQYHRFRADCRQRARDLNDLVELSKGLEEWLEPGEELVRRSAVENPVRAIEAAQWLAEQYGRELRPSILDAWLGSKEERPDLEELSQVVVDCPRWESELAHATKRHLEAIDRILESDYAVLDPEPSASVPLPDSLAVQVDFCVQLEATGLNAGSKSAGRLCTHCMLSVRHTAHFLPLLDAFLERKVLPDDVEAVVAAARKLGIDPQEVYDRVGDALRQLEFLIRGDGRDAERYQRLSERAKGIPEELMSELCAIASRNHNLEAIASLLAINLGSACAHLSEDIVPEAMGYRGIGSGPNLLKQWFGHRHSIHDPLRSQIKSMVKDALIELAFDWMGKAGGSGKQGLVPQSATRPFRVGDELDSVDIENSLDALVMSGRRLEEATPEDLYVAETARGRAALCMLIDISGSMSGEDLAICSVAVVMLLGKLAPQEVSLAVFESNTHVMKSFDEDADLDELADKVLELQATGGTQVGAALTWAREQLVGMGEADQHILFVLSDFAFFEKEEELRQHGLALADLGLTFLAAHHGYVDRSSLEVLRASMGGQVLKMGSLQKLPALLIDVLAQIGDGSLR
jgi:Mg-chelatase subunit ChlD